jgi:hypothetical protein
MIRDDNSDKAPKGTKRSTKWPAVRKAHLAKFPTCAVCGGKKKLEAHHVSPFHLYPDLELSPGNLITLCENKGYGLNCHLLFGHLGNFKSVNAAVREDATSWHVKLVSRPK